jgi:hypothetical protein
MTTESCATCTYFRRHLQNVTEGFCRRFPPVVIIAPIGNPPAPRPVSASPNMDEKEWCGEWRTRIWK